MIRTVEKVQAWARNRGIDKADPIKQYLKLAEEVGEVAGAMARGDDENLTKEIGDVMVVLTVICMQKGFSLHSCYKAAYEKIKNRTGINVNGIFVKQDDVKK